MTFGDRLAKARKEKKLTQQELADKIGVAKSTVAGYERNNREPDLHKIKLLISALGVSFDYLAKIDTSHYRSTYAEELEQPIDDGINLYSQLDEIDKAEIRGEMKQMLKADKYNTLAKGTTA